MDYHQSRNGILNGDILAFKGTSWISKVIRWWTSSDITHIGFAIWWEGRLFCLEAREGKGVRAYPLSTYLKEDHVIDWYQLLSDKYKIDRNLVTSSALGDVGKSYASVWQFLRSWGMVSSTIANKLRIPEDTNTQRFFCSEFVLSKLRTAGYVAKGFLKEPAETYPGDIVSLPCLEIQGVLEYDPAKQQI